MSLVLTQVNVSAKLYIYEKLICNQIGPNYLSRSRSGHEPRGA